jgi:peptidoglycan hydrolase-like protein with peptidoglycan-binding domain
MTYALIWLADILAAAGLKVAEQPGWRLAGRGEMGTVQGVMCHHTAGPATGNMPSLGIITRGRPDLAGPLAQLGLGRDGTYYVVAAGRANHAGDGNWRGLTNGNHQFIGIEAENTGAPEDKWPDVQMDAYARGAAALLRKLGQPASLCCGHKEYALPAGRKQDPSFDMTAFRTRVDTILHGGAPPLLIPAQDDTTGKPTLRRGMQGPLVAALQTSLGITPADGLFGAHTEAAIRLKQAKANIVPDGIVGPKTWAALAVA